MNDRRTSSAILRCLLLTSRVLVHHVESIVHYRHIEQAQPTVRDALVQTHAAKDGPEHVSSRKLRQLNFYFGSGTPEIDPLPSEKGPMESMITRPATCSISMNDMSSYIGF